MADKKLVFFDIDGTLWDNQNVIAPSTKEALYLLKQNGHETFLCSGRARGYIQHPALLSLGFDGVISGCGTMVEYHDEVIFYRRLDNERLIETLRTIRSYGFRPILEGPQYLYLDIDEFEGDRYYAKLSKDLGDEIQSIADHWGTWNVCKFSCATTGCDTKSCFSAIEDEFDFLVHNEHVVEVVPKGYDKGTGIEMIVRYLGAKMEDTFAFGDSVNDIGMIRAAHVGIAMGNAKDALKQEADYITLSMQEGGIYEACRYFGLIP